MAVTQGVQKRVEKFCARYQNGITAALSQLMCEVIDQELWGIAPHIGLEAGRIINTQALSKQFPGVSGHQGRQVRVGVRDEPDGCYRVDGLRQLAATTALQRLGGHRIQGIQRCSRCVRLSPCLLGDGDDDGGLGVCRHG